MKFFYVEQKNTFFGRHNAFFLTTSHNFCPNFKIFLKRTNTTPMNSYNVNVFKERPDYINQMKKDMNIVANPHIKTINLYGDKLIHDEKPTQGGRNLSHSSKNDWNRISHTGNKPTNKQSKGPSLNNVDVYKNPLDIDITKKSFNGQAPSFAKKDNNQNVTPGYANPLNYQDVNVQGSKPQRYPSYGAGANPYMDVKKNESKG